MKSRFLPLWVIVSIQALSFQAFSAEKASPGSAVDALAVPKSASTAAIALERGRIARYLGRRSQPVFSKSESASLNKLGDAGLGYSLKTRFDSKKEFEAFIGWAKKNAPHFEIEINPLARVTESSLTPLQWGLKNPGGKYSVEVDDFTTQELAAVAGEDSGLEGVLATPVEAEREIIVAVLDSGVDINHPALKAAIVRNESECAAQKQYLACVAKQGAAKCAGLIIDHDGNGYPLDCNGWNLAAENDGQGMRKPGPLPRTAGILGNSRVADYIGHGTHVAGIIAARPSDESTEGVAPRAKILPVRVISGEPNERIRAQELSRDLPEPQESSVGAGVGYGLGDVVARGVLYAIRSKAQVINMSLGWPDPLDSELLRRMIRIARTQGILLVAAAGNDSTEHVIFPCRYDGVVCVGAYAPDGALAFFSNYGPGVDILAPGWNIVSTFPTNLLPLHFTDQSGYESKDGTSMAAPFISGMLARMLGAGMGSDEAYSRLMLGARPTRLSQIEDPALFAHASLSGNADLARSFKVTPQALILPASKESVRIEWDRSGRTVSMTFALEDHWVDAQEVDVSVVPMSPSMALGQNSWKISEWKAGEQKQFRVQMALPDDRVDSVQDFRLQVKASNAAFREFSIRGEMVVPVAASSAPGRDLKVFPLVDSNGARVSRAYDEVRTVVGGEAHEYVGIHSDKSGKALELLTEEIDQTGEGTASRLRIRGALVLPASGNQIRAIYKTREPKYADGNYVLLEALPAQIQGQVGSSQLTWLDSRFNPRTDHPVEKLDIGVTYFSEDFQWQMRSGELVPTWYSLGKTPPSEKKPYDPWDPSAFNRPSFRVFMLATDGIHSLALPKEYPTLVSLTEQTPEQREKGIVSVLLAKGQDYALQYASAELVEGRWSNVRPVTLPVYHNLRGIVASPVLSLDPRNPVVATAFPGYVATDVGPKGSRRTTVIGSFGAVDLSAYPLRNFDAVTDISGTFLGAKRQAQFTLTKYEIQFHDFTEKKAVMTSQNRFSFLPTIFSLKSFFPVLVRDDAYSQVTGDARLPALFVPGDFIFSKATQVVLPEYDSAGHLMALVRPAKFHLESQPGCTALPTPKASSSSGPAELVFFCGDRMLSIPLIY